MADVVFDKENHIYTVDGKIVPSVTQILDLLSYEEFGKIDKSTLEYASKRGTAIHEATESLDLGLETEVDAETEPYVKAYMDFTRDYKPTWLGIEEMVYHPEFEFCGTIDRIGRQQVHRDGHQDYIISRQTRLHKGLYADIYVWLMPRR